MKESYLTKQYLQYYKNSFSGKNILKPRAFQTSMKLVKQPTFIPIISLSEGNEQTAQTGCLSPSIFCSIEHLRREHWFLVKLKREHLWRQHWLSVKLKRGRINAFQELKYMKDTAVSKVSKYGFFSGPSFPAFGPNLEIYEVNLRI